MKFLISFLFILFFNLKPAFLLAQTIVPSFETDILIHNPIDSNSKLKVIAININGNKKTKTYIILNEIQFKVGDSVIAGNLYENLLSAKQQVYNTSLFTDVAITPTLLEGSQVIINVSVKEKWYIFPTPQFQMVDRNFNEWVKIYHASLDRVIYGAKFAHYNFSGRRDQLRIYLLNGYARNIAFSYIAPASNKKLTDGFGILASYTQNREVPYKTAYNNELLQYKNEKKFIRSIFNTTLSYSVRKNLFKTQVYSIGYSNINATDSLISSAYNPSYFNTGKSAAKFLDFSYYYQYIKTNNNKYPLSGTSYSLLFLKRGLQFTGGVNKFSIDGTFSKYLKHKNNWYSSLELSGKLKLPFTQPYLNQKALGYKEFYLRGLEYYVVDGVATSLAKYTLRKQVISFNIPLPFHVKTIPNIPITIFAKAYADVGYSYSKQANDSYLNNRFLYTEGLGMDILTVYDLSFRVEFSFNQLGENGLFLHAKVGF
jgi:hypothetical protein